MGASGSQEAGTFKGKDKAKAKAKAKANGEAGAVAADLTDDDENMCGSAYSRRTLPQGEKRPVPSGPAENPGAANKQKKKTIHVSHVMSCHNSCITCHMSHVKCHVSCITYLLSLTSSVADPPPANSTQHFVKKGFFSFAILAIHSLKRSLHFSRLRLLTAGTTHPHIH